MASEKAVGVALKMLARAFAGTVDPERVEVYIAALSDLSDDDVARATTFTIRNYTGEYIPPPAVLRSFVRTNAEAIDTGAIVRRIEKLATYVPNSGMVYPPVVKVREAMGDAAAYAYAAAGGVRLFADNQTTRDIASREFERALIEARRAVIRGVSLPILGVDALLPSVTPEQQRLTDGNDDDDDR